jgi:hypothetical protein
MDELILFLIMFLPGVAIGAVRIWIAMILEDERR